MANSTCKTPVHFPNVILILLSAKSFSLNKNLFLAGNCKKKEEELIRKVKELEKQAGKLRVKGTLYSLFGNSELDKAEQRITELEKEAEQQRHLTEKEKNEIRKEVIHLQDTIKGKDKTISEQQREIKVYEEELSFIQRFFNSFYLFCAIFV